ncbi:MAG: DNA-binding response regulator [Actinobacteria bacterium]|nr:DNA-binding response regulator [Actinomycetota bacterium]
MPTIHLGGEGWSLARAWPETFSHERWQQQLTALLRGTVQCRSFLMRSNLPSLRFVAIDWSHPGIGKVTSPDWERSTRRARGSIIERFTVGDSNVSFTAGSNGRRTVTSATTAHVNTACDTAEERMHELTLEEPIRVCSETAAALALMCEAVTIVALNIVGGPVVVDLSSTQPPKSSARDTVSPQLRARLDELDPFQSKVLELICGGWTNAEIATETRMSLSSVRAATSVIYERLEVRNRHEAAALCGAAFTRRIQSI